MADKRKQLTLFVPEDHAAFLEKIRQKYNPIQYNLIPSHVTLCREDEIEPLERVLENLQTLKMGELLIYFDPISRFSEGKGLMMPGAPTNEAFYQLRKNVLKGVQDIPRNHQPHLTLMHPRNSTCTDEIFRKLSSLSFPHYFSFQKISLIEQEIGRKWEVLREFAF